MTKIAPVSIRETGRIEEIRKSVIKIKGLPNCMLGQIINFSDGTKGFVMEFREDEVLVLLLGVSRELKAGGEVYSEEQSFKVPVGYNFLGRIVDALCKPMDGKGYIAEDAFSNVFSDAPQVLDRVPVDEMFETGIRIVDSSISIGKGQRQLILGDRMTGKTTIAVDTILNQRGKDVICLYCCIGRDYASFEKIVGIFREKKCLDYTIIVSALAFASIGEQYIAPYAAAALGEYFMRLGRDVFIVFDDLTKHAWAYRELSLLLERSPGKEAYPGDIFYLHAQLMEKAARLSPEMGGGSMTFFPIADTLQGDITGFIPTNLISMTDGQVYLSSDLFSEGFKPAIDIGLSVSRIGSKVQSKAMIELTKDVGLQYIQYRELLKATRLRAGVSEEFSSRLKHGEKVGQILMQDKGSPSPMAEQLIMFYALKKGVLDILSAEKCQDFKKNIFDFAQKKYPELPKKLMEESELKDKTLKELNECIIGFFGSHI